MSPTAVVEPEVEMAVSLALAKALVECSSPEQCEGSSALLPFLTWAGGSCLGFGL